MNINFEVDIGVVNASRTGTIKIDDCEIEDMTKEEIQEYIDEVVFDHITQNIVNISYDIKE